MTPSSTAVAAAAAAPLRNPFPRSPCRHLLSVSRSTEEAGAKFPRSRARASTCAHSFKKREKKKREKRDKRFPPIDVHEYLPDNNETGFSREETRLITPVPYDLVPSFVPPSPGRTPGTTVARAYTRDSFIHMSGAAHCAANCV